jgi:RNA polymerase sigma-70 factor, ECF subfamily
MGTMGGPVSEQTASGDGVFGEGFEEEFETHRRALLAHCYRMTGSYHDAEDLVQETYLRARKGLGEFEERSSLKTWLYRIATNTCLTALNHKSRRVLPSGLGAPSATPDAALGEDLSVPWLEPLPEAALARAGVADPALAVIERESVRLALVVALQELAPRQRAALLLREVLAWSAEDIAAAMDLSVPAVKSLLQRARARIAEVQPDAERAGRVVADPEVARVERELLDRWIAAFEAADVGALKDLIREDFTLEAVPHKTWFQGLDVCLPFLDQQWRRFAGVRALATRVNGQPAAVSFRQDAGGGYRARGLVVLTIDADHGRIARATHFHGARGVLAAGFPATLLS